MQLIPADFVLAIHGLFVAFVILGLAAILPGWYWRWRWIRNRWFRISHLLAIGVVIAESWLGLILPAYRVGEPRQGVSRRKRLFDLVHPALAAHDAVL